MCSSLSLSLSLSLFLSLSLSFSFFLFLFLFSSLSLSLSLNSLRQQTVVTSKKHAEIKFQVAAATTPIPLTALRAGKLSYHLPSLHPLSSPSHPLSSPSLTSTL